MLWAAATADCRRLLELFYGPTTQSQNLSAVTFPVGFCKNPLPSGVADAHSDNPKNRRADEELLLVPSAAMPAVEYSPAESHGGQ